MSVLNSWSKILKAGTLETVDSQVILIEEILQPKLELMRVNIDLKESSTYFRVMRETSESEAAIMTKSTEQKITSSLMSFLAIENFPDAIILEINDDGIPVFHILELKRYPPNQFEKLSKQFISGYLHCKTISSLLHFENEVLYEYYIVYNENVLLEKIEENRLNEKYNQSNPPRNFTGSLPNKVNKKFDDWISNNTLKFYFNNHSYVFTNIVNVPLPFYSSIENKDEYQNSIKI